MSEMFGPLDESLLRPVSSQLTLIGLKPFLRANRRACGCRTMDSTMDMVELTLAQRRGHLRQLRL